ncbi:MAG: RlmE family RNA methyltransferase [Thermoplasmata archaeon]|nr:RlmE family RNA methyltransferase [Thermoplasmata archaeon]MCI4337569.1 RlmE family RNA methyltransferase [Thermoplasmata archaeon]
MGRRFVAERRYDRFYRAAQEEGLRSRAAFKLGHLAGRFPIFHRGDRVLDLGAAPGGWSVVARQTLGRSGAVVAVDPRPIEPIPGVMVVRGRVGDVTLPSRLGPEPFDVVLSDMSPRISGAYSTDHARSVALVRDAFGLAREVLAPGGTMVVKVFDGDLLDELEKELETSFDKVVRTKPPASRERSSELYLLAFKFHRSRPADRAPA